ncbi:hypothetical protein FRX31_015988 [Thalictrum thalictroides]|uniref:Uncharacterized protein n=1 Tax=Thalictrum thalictroides TaxID=46969 RepID=A0A7J6V121_THATH|nr:hypothetical protein FRX31_031745 [Thalictrum thalictroides]KAF5194425.1 hypothetical protein FRX31_015988 [Thalictrum thalictroides]
MAMTKVLLPCIAAFLICSLLCKSTSATTEIYYGSIGRNRIPCKFGKCNDHPQQKNHYTRGCTKIKHCKGTVGVDPEDKELN